MSKGMYVVLTNCADPARHEEYNRWYCHSHLPDLAASDGLARARRYVNSEPETGWAQYLALYEFESDDLVASRKDLSRIGREVIGRGRQIDCLAGVGGHLYEWIDPAVLEPLESFDYPPRESPIPSDLSAPPAQTLARTSNGGLLIVTSNCGDPSRDEEYNRWYSHIHQPDLKPAKGLVSVNRYRNTSPDGEPSVYMATYEFKTDDFWESRVDFFRLAEMTFPSRHIDCHESRGKGGWFQEIDAGAYEPLEVLDYPRTASWA